MKRIVVLSILLCITPLLIAKKHCCPDREEFDRLQELQRCIDTIKSKVCKIQDVVDGIDTEIDNLTVIATCSGLDDLENDISILSETLCSKIENLEEVVIETASASDVFLCSKIENINVTATCSGIEELEEQVSILGETLCSKIENLEEVVIETGSVSDIFVCSKIGSFDDSGSCLDSQIDVPEDINDLDLNVIQLLKTILLELRGCNAC